jgi:hypothetical protein
VVDRRHEDRGWISCDRSGEAHERDGVGSARDGEHGAAGLIEDGKKEGSGFVAGQRQRRPGRLP